MTSTIGFATHGEALKQLYLAFGVLPRKEARAEDFDERDKKTLQRQLGRLASEEGNLIENYQKAVATLRQLLGQYLPVPGHVATLGTVLDDLESAYAELIQTEGTYLGQRDSLRYFMSIKAVPVLVLALKRCRLLCGLGDGPGVWRDDTFWYLPTFEADNKVTMPLAKVMRWAYAACGLSQKQFHCPGKPGDTVSPAQQQNLGNAVNWARGKGTPSLPALLANFKESFVVQDAHGRPIDPQLQESVLTALVCARVASFIAKQVLDTYGAAYLQNLCAQIQQLTELLEDEVQEFLRQLAPVMQRQASADQAVGVWLRACADHERFVRGKLMQVAATLADFLEKAPQAPFLPELLAGLARRFGGFAVHANVDRITRQRAVAPPEGFVVLLAEGLQLRRNATTTLDEIDAFEQSLVQMGLQEVLDWFVPWLRGIYHYRREQFEAAYPYYERAFELAKYKAGHLQYDLVNQFVELAAKNHRENAFDKGIDWALYIGLEIRWLRDKEPTQENRNFVRAIMERANYAHQL
ncbi:hypothetical protein [Massilia brevitalea]|uniref:hypothetical protein n=1 Tax=Massilia brevitalea TaxID=442526 RepID=UPI002739B7CB|nr:hypothetical protein [Massilia brevitalea]